jgi:hypothetical protein
VLSNSSSMDVTLISKRWCMNSQERLIFETSREVAQCGRVDISLVRNSSSLLLSVQSFLCLVTFIIDNGKNNPYHLIEWFMKMNGSRISP